MISIQNSLSALEQSLKQREAVFECYVAALEDIRQYAVELDDRVTGPHREGLQRLAREVNRAGQERIGEARGFLRALLRDYHDKAGEYLARLREELAGSAAALQDIVRSMCQADGSQEERVIQAIGSLKSLSVRPEAAGIAEGLRTAVETVEKGLDDARKQQQLAISQLLTEIRVLHKRIETLEVAASIDKATNLLRRSRIEEHLRETPGNGHSILVLRARGLKTSAGGGELAVAFARRLRSCLPAAAVVGRWAEEDFVAILPVGKPEAMAVADQLTSRLSGTYTCVRDGSAVRSALQIVLAIVDAEAGRPAKPAERVSRFFEKA